MQAMLRELAWRRCCHELVGGRKSVRTEFGCHDCTLGLVSKAATERISQKRLFGCLNRRELQPWNEIPQSSLSLGASGSKGQWQCSCVLGAICYGGEISSR